MRFFEGLFDTIGDSFNLVTRGIERGLTGLFGSANAREIKRLQPRVAAINALEETMKAMSDEELRGQTEKFRRRLADGAKLDDLLVEAFATCREASRRVLGMRHYDVQLMGGMVLHGGNIAEMVTGEGKTLVATLPSYLNALEGKGVHVVTVNDYLARRDMEWMGPIHLALGLRVGAIYSNMPAEERQAAYEADITYGTNNEFGFDYLRDNMRHARKGDDRYPRHMQQCQGPLNYAIVDEVDNILIDEARTPLIISGPAHDDVTRYRKADQIARKLRKDEHFEVNEKERTTHLTDEGVRFAEQLADVESFYTAGNMEWPHLIDNSLKAHYLYIRDVNYIVQGDEVIIVDEFTGRLMPGRNWSDGLHQAVEAKEGVRVKEENQTLATITLQNYFKLYKKIAGMTGTAMTEANEFWKIYKLNVVAIPTNRPMQRINHPDVIYRSEREKYDALAQEIERLHKWDVLLLANGEEQWGVVEKENDSEVVFVPKGSRKHERVPKSKITKIEYAGRPILVGTVSIERSEQISATLTKRGIPHQVLNAKHHRREAEIIAQAGRKGAVTIATNMAGRGTDIVLGGNPEAKAWALLQEKYASRLDVPRDEWDTLTRDIELKENMKADGEAVRRMGGLHVIGTERHEARRIDLQLRGRCGRQGDPGSSRFYLSLDDDLMRIFAGEWVKSILTRLGMEEGQAIESRMVSRRIEGAQKKREEFNFEIRKNLLEYDEVMDEQRKRVYGYRQRILDGADCKGLIFAMIDSQIRFNIGNFLARDYGAASFAEFATRRLTTEFNTRDFRNIPFKQAEEYARDHAKRMADGQIYDAIEENLPEEEEERDWNWQALTKWANARFHANLRDRDLRQLGRDKVAEFLIEKANEFIDRVDLAEGAPLLEPDYGQKVACHWVRQKFGIDFGPDDVQGVELEEFIEMAIERAMAAYQEKEIEFPVRAALLRFTIRDAQGFRRYDREPLAEWANRRFGVEMCLEDLKNKQRHEIEETLFEQSRLGSQKAAEVLAEARRRVAEAFENQPAPETNHKPGEYLDPRHDATRALIDWLRENLQFSIEPRELARIEREELQSRVDAAVEARCRPEMQRLERSLVLQLLDMAWKDHLLSMDHLRSAVGMRGYGQLDPKVEYKREGMRTFEAMWNSVNERVTDLIFRMEQLDERFVSSTWTETSAIKRDGAAAADDIQRQQQAAIEGSEQAGAKSEPFRRKEKKVGRNEPCPCNSGKKYKQCCGRNQ